MLNYILLFFLATALCDEQKKPNFVVIITDDQDAVLDGMYTTSPICCPSRASFLTGQYIHNHSTKNNSLSGGCYGNKWRHLHEDNTFATVLMNAGYSTFYAGKYLNQYGVKEAGGPSKVPPGWTEWHGLVGNSVYYDYTISNNGVPTRSTNEYLTDVI
ncbi:Sulfatase, partial [Operophtera brumata]